MRGPPSVRRLFARFDKSPAGQPRLLWRGSAGLAPAGRAQEVPACRPPVTRASTPPRVGMYMMFSHLRKAVARLLACLRQRLHDRRPHRGSMPSAAIFSPSLHLSPPDRFPVVRIVILTAQTGGAHTSLAMTLAAQLTIFNCEGY